MKISVAILDYDQGNLASLSKALSRLGGNPQVISTPAQLNQASHIVLPGVGHFQRAMEALQRKALLQPLEDAVHQRKVPTLGICLGMQLMARQSQEGSAPGLGWLEADVIRFQIQQRLRFKVPHIGWNACHPQKDSFLFQGIPPGALFYFMHTFHLNSPPSTEVLSETEYEYRFVSAVQKQNLVGVQFHPEKSQEVGERLLKNFLEQSGVPT